MRGNPLTPVFVSARLEQAPSFVMSPIHLLTLVDTLVILLLVTPLSQDALALTPNDKMKCNSSILSTLSQGFVM